MERIHRQFRSLPSQEAVAKLLLRHGISVREGKAYCGDIEQSDTAIAKAAGVDRRVVRSAIDRIMLVEELRVLFSSIQPMLLLSDAARELGCSTVEIVPTDATIPGIMAGIMNVISGTGLNIRQAVVSDPQNRTGSHLIIVTDGNIPGDVMTQIRDCPGVDSVIIK